MERNRTEKDSEGADGVRKKPFKINKRKRRERKIKNQTN